MSKSNRQNRRRKIPPSMIEADYSYQRPIDEAFVRKITANWRWDLMGMPVVSLRKNGTYYVVDGNHRVEGRRRIDPNTPVDCEVVEGLTIPEEARLFNDLNRNRRYVVALARFKAEVRGNIPDAVEIQNIVTDTGFIVAFGSGNKTISAVGCLEYVHKRMNNLQRVLEILKPWAEFDDRVTDGTIIRGVALFLLTFGDKVSDARLTAVLRKRAAVTVIGDIRALSRDFPRRIASQMALRTIYNRAVRSKKDKLPRVKTVHDEQEDEDRFDE